MYSGIFPISPSLPFSLFISHCRTKRLLRHGRSGTSPYIKIITFTYPSPFVIPCSIFVIYFVGFASLNPTYTAAYPGCAAPTGLKQRYPPLTQWATVVTPRWGVFVMPRQGLYNRSPLRKRWECYCATLSSPGGATQVCNPLPHKTSGRPRAARAYPRKSAARSFPFDIRYSFCRASLRATPTRPLIRLVPPLRG